MACGAIRQHAHLALREREAHARRIGDLGRAPGARIDLLLEQEPEDRGHQVGDRQRQEKGEHVPRRGRKGRRKRGRGGKQGGQIAVSYRPPRLSASSAPAMSRLSRVIARLCAATSAS
jgi:hypothetical protein